MPSLSEPELERLQEAACQAAGLERTAFLDGLIAKSLNRYPPLVALEEGDEEGGEADPDREVTLGELDGGLDAAVTYTADMLRHAGESPYFPLVRRVAEEGDSDAFEQLMGTLDRNLKIRGIFFRHRLDPEQEVPGIWGRIWEAIPKWDGRDFRAYVARIVRNYCLDEIHRRKKTPTAIDEDPSDPRPRVRSAALPSQHDTLAFLGEVLDELEATGRIKPLDAVIFALVCQARTVADILETLHDSPAGTALADAIAALGPRRGVLGAAEVVALRYLLEGLTAEETAALTGRSVEPLAEAAQALAGVEAEDDRALADLLVREGMTAADLGRARRLTANALNLCINRIRLKVWMALVDRAYETLRRRGRVDDVDLAIVSYRCTVPTHSGCRMYKDRTCKRERDPAEVARTAGLDLSGAAVGERMTELRHKIVEEGLARIFPDYNACLNERKSARGGRGS